MFREEPLNKQIRDLREQIEAARDSPLVVNNWNVNWGDWRWPLSLVATAAMFCFAFSPASSRTEVRWEPPSPVRPVSQVARPTMQYSTASRTFFISPRYDFLPVSGYADGYTSCETEYVCDSRDNDCDAERRWGREHDPVYFIDLSGSMTHLLPSVITAADAMRPF